MTDAFPVPIAPLQWGHGRETVETNDDLAALTNVPRLQWGHGRETVETLQFARFTPHPALLQWGHGRETVETSGRAQRNKVQRCFNGATVVRPWKQQWHQGFRALPDRFNGATVVRPWKLAGGAAVRIADDASMGPRS